MTILGKLGYAVSVCFMEPAIILFLEKKVTTIFFALFAQAASSGEKCMDYVLGRRCR